jgi:hypothetical protein
VWHLCPSVEKLSSPRDTITICKTLSDANTIVDVATSLPRSADEPAYLRPAPPYVRSHAHIFALCVQLPAQTTTDGRPSGKARITALWQWDLKGAVFSQVRQHIASLLVDYVDYVRTHSDKIPFLTGYGKGIEFNFSLFDPAQDTLVCEYSILNVDDASDHSVKDDLDAVKERKRLEGAIELALAPSHGWDVQVVPRGQGQGVDTSWSSTAETLPGSNRTVLRLSHASVDLPENIVKVSITVRRLVGGKAIRVNRNQIKVSPAIDLRNPSSIAIDGGGGEDTTSLRTVETGSTGASSSSAADVVPEALAIAPIIRRSYIYFTSLLQEPEAKWRQLSDTRGVNVTQLNSIDPTLTIYRAEATFVGVGVWDVFATVATPGARLAWDKGLESVQLIDDLDELSKLWHVKSKASWPVLFVFFPLLCAVERTELMFVFVLARVIRF